MSKIIEILNYEEGFKSKPYIDTEGYPTIGIGFRIGPKKADLKNYQFTLPKEASDAWLQSFVYMTHNSMKETNQITYALIECNDARTDVLISMAYQMGVAGLAGFKNTLALIAAGNFSGAADGMMGSKWAKQTPNRAKRHAEVMRTGTYDAYNGLLK